MNKLLFSALVTTLVTLGAVGTASADAMCEDIDIVITNEFVHNGDNKDIKVVDLQFWDQEDQTWRNEDLPDARIGWGDTHVYTRNLQKVGGEDGVRIRLFFKYNRGGTAWSDRLEFFSHRFTCIDGHPVAITVN